MYKALSLILSTAKQEKERKEGREEGRKERKKEKKEGRKERKERKMKERKKEKGCSLFSITSGAQYFLLHFFISLQAGHFNSLRNL
jgi:hypothetical protein